MKGLLILIPVATVILIILLIIKRKREAMYKERRKFWLQDVGKSILYAAYLKYVCSPPETKSIYFTVLMQELIVSNRKLMHIIAALVDQQKVCYQSQLKPMVQNF